MTNQTPKNVTFKIRLVKQIEHAFIGFCCLFLSACMVWIFLYTKNRWDILFILFMGLLTFTPLAGAFIYGSSIIRSSLTFSVDGVFFQGPIFSMQVPWDEVKGFTANNGEIYLCIEKPKGMKKANINIPLSWFAKIQPNNKQDKPDPVMQSLSVFAPQLFKAQVFD